MFYHQVYAEILDKEVKNIMVSDNYEMANIIARETYGEDAIAVECTFWNCVVGDIYENNKFYDKEMHERMYLGNEEENITWLKEKNSQLEQQASEDNNAILNLDWRVSQLEEA